MIKLYNRALSAQEILQNYNANAITRAGYAFPATPAVLLQASTYSGSGTWLDQSPNAANATIENGVAAKNGAGNGVVLNGSTNWIFKNIAAGNTWTCSAWYKNTGSLVGSNPCILTQIYTGGTINICLGFGAVQGVSFWDGSTWRSGTAITITNSSWTYYTGVWNGTSMVTYINGVAQGTTTPGGTSTDAGNQYRIGRRWDSAEYMVGEVGEIRVYKIALTAAQVLADYNFTRTTYGV
jgi:hypothetical protein